MAHEELEELKAQLAQTQQALDRANAVIQWMEGSHFWKLRLAYLKLRQKLSFLSRRSLFSPAIAAGASISPAVLNGSYLTWQQQNMPRSTDLEKLAETIEVLPHKPLISVIMPVFNTSEPLLREAIESVLHQIYPHWELCMADDASTAPHVREVLSHYQARDRRIKVAFREINGHISQCSNSALELATGEFVALLDHDDLLTPDALYEVALLVNRHPQADMIYSDEDKVDEKGQLSDPFFKPDWCPDSFLSRMYTCHLGVYRRALVDAIEGFRPGFEGSQDYDLVLRFTERTNQIFHIPKILYHWRIHNQSTARNPNRKNYAIDAAQKALEEALQRRGEPGNVTPPKGYPGCYIVRYDLRELKPVTIVIPTRDLGSVLDRCLTSIFHKTTYPNYEVLVIDNGSTEASTFSIFEKWETQEPKRFRRQIFDVPFNFSKLNNYAVEQSQGEYLLFLNNDTEVITPDWLTAMVEQAQRPQIGAVGARLLYPDGTLQHAGIVAGIGGVAGHSHKYFSGDHVGYFSQIQTINNYSAVTAACLMCRRDVFEEVGGFEEDLAIAFNDVDFCFKLLERGYRNVYLPHAMLYHHESKSRGYEDTPAKQARFQHEILYIKGKWKKMLDHDPCYSRHLTKDREDYSLNV
jgi:GT2 family glycosyltransferase